MKIMKPNKGKKNIQDYSILSISHILYSTTHICLVLILFLISYMIICKVKDLTLQFLMDTEQDEV